MTSKESMRDSMNFSQTSSQRNMNHFQNNMGFPPIVPNIQQSNMMQSNMVAHPNF
jgi:hypothetical protein